MRIVIASCSWGAGVWSGWDDLPYRIIHPGVSGYLQDAGFDVVNLSIPGGHISGINSNLENFVICNQHTPMSLYFIQSDIGRSLAYSDKIADDTIERIILRHYIREYETLNTYAQKYNQVINVIGGLTDVIVDLERFTHLRLLLDSWCRLADPSVPLTGIVDQPGIDYLDQNYPARRAEIETVITAALARRDFWRNNPGMFHPDGQHPNQNLHRLLADLIMTNESANAQSKI